MVVIGALPKEAFQFQFRVDFRPPEDFHPRVGGQTAPPPADGPRPELRVLLALQDMDCARQDDPTTKKSMVVRPMRGLALAFGEKEIRLLRVVQGGADMWGRKTQMQDEVLARASAPLGAHFPVSLNVAGNQLTVRVGDKPHTFKLPPEHMGFLGFHILGEGYVGVGTIHLDPPQHSSR